ncbi:hypothetical protein [Thiolapillus sp.]|uniref:hypothetical protein n=1 Tax=Thiolapillus sp. TaxID=2017437 RepID=UPI003AF819E8
MGKLENDQRCVERFITQNYRDCTSGCVTNMLNDLGLQPLQERRKQQRLAFFFKTVRGLISANEYLTPVRSKRLMKPRNPKDFKKEKNL